jgi:hypothetical protein
MATTEVISSLKSRAVRIARFHFAIVLLFSFQTIVYHASKVITPDLLLKRWIATAGLLVVATILWYFAKNRVTNLVGFKAIIYALIIADIAFASFNVYTQRGYASKSVVLFVIPIFIAAALANRSALFATALLSIAAYTTTAVMYFVNNFNEGYSAELYGEIGFYSALYLLLAGLLWTLIRKRK